MVLPIFKILKYERAVILVLFTAVPSNSSASLSSLQYFRISSCVIRELYRVVLEENRFS